MILRSFLCLGLLLCQPLFASQREVTPQFEADFSLNLKQSSGEPALHFSKSSDRPAREFFSVNTLYLRNRYLIHVGRDLINQNYAVFPSPNLLGIQKLSNGKSRVTIQQYFPDLEDQIIKAYSIPANRLLYLYITSYQIFDQSGREITNIVIPEGVQYRPPQTIQVDVDSDVNILSFVFGFSGRTGWANSGFSSDLQGVFQDLRDIGIDNESAIHFEVNPGTGAKLYDVLTGVENMKISQILSNFHFIAAWGKFAQKDQLLDEITSLKNFQSIDINLSNAAEDLKKYPEIFGNPLDPKWLSVLNKISSEKLTENEMNNERSGSGSGSLSLDVSNLFKIGGQGASSNSSKVHSRFKEMLKFEIEGNFYVPKSIHFTLRTANSLHLIKSLLLQVYDTLEEAQFRYGSGLSLEELSAGKEVTYTAAFPSDHSWGAKSVCEPTTVTYTGTITRMSPDGGVGVTWRRLVSNNVKPAYAHIDCTWNRTGGTSEWAIKHFGTDTTNPTFVTGLLSVFPPELVYLLQIVK
jgi:hypothetical protein